MMGDFDIAPAKVIDTIMAANMPLNHWVAHIIALTFTYLQEYDQPDLCIRSDFIRLFTYIEPYLQVKRTLPKNRDPFRIYMDELDGLIAHIFKDAAMVAVMFKM
jgi:hypothetical protein